MKFRDLPYERVNYEKTEEAFKALIEKAKNAESGEALWAVHQEYYPNSKYLFPANSANGVITNNTIYDFYRRTCKKLGIEINREFRKGTHSFRRNAITDVINSSGGNVILASKLFGNSPEVAKKNYFTGIDMENALECLTKRKFS